jgi:hypothetical protein
MKRSFEEKVGENGGHGMAAYNDFSAGGARLFEDNAPRTFQTAGCEALTQGERKRIKMGQHDSVVRFLKWCIQATHRPLEESADFSRTAEETPPPMPFRSYFFGANGVLRKAGAGATLPLLRVIPAGLHLGGVLGEIDAEIQPHLLRSSLAEEDRVHERTGDGRSLLWKRDGDACGLSYGFCFAKNHFENRAVYCTIWRIEQH